MREFFRGWRRMMGVMTLVTGLMLTGLWVRSFEFCEGIGGPIGDRAFKVTSLNGDITWWSYDPAGRMKVVPYAWSDAVERGQIMVLGGIPTLFRPMSLTIPYLSIVIPLALLSAYLMLSKPRPRKPPDEVQVTHA